MSTVLVVLVYAVAMAIPSFLLYRTGSYGWYWHLLAIGAAVAVGVMPTPPALANPPGELLTGVMFVFLMVWGIGGLIAVRPHREKHA